MWYYYIRNFWVLLTNEHLCEGTKFPNTANKFMVRKHVTGMKYSFGMKNSGWARLISVMKNIHGYIMWRSWIWKEENYILHGFKSNIIPEHTEGYTVKVTKNIKKTLRHWGKHWRKIRQYGKEWMTRNWRPDFFFSCTALE